MGGWTKTKLMLFSTQVEVEVGVELGNYLDKECLGPSLEDRKSQFCHSAAKQCCGSGNHLICSFLIWPQSKVGRTKKHVYLCPKLPTCLVTA